MSPHDHLFITRHRRPSITRRRPQFMSGRRTMGGITIEVIVVDEAGRARCKERRGPTTAIIEGWNIEQIEGDQLFPNTTCSWLKHFRPRSARLAEVGMARTGGLCSKQKPRKRWPGLR